jgi:hypothetical protein
MTAATGSCIHGRSWMCQTISATMKT